VDDLLVGYKFIAEQIGKLPDPGLFVFAAEESLGYLAGDFVRDKDGAIASLLVAELASWVKDRGKTLIRYLDDVYREYGYYKNAQHLIELPHQAGLEIMATIMRGLRARPPEALAGFRIGVRDFLREELRDPAKYRMGSGDDMLALLVSEDGRSRITVRPSGTEPKLKCYFQHHGDVAGDLDVVRQRVDGEVEALRQALAAYNRTLLPRELQSVWDAAVHRVI